MQPSRVQVPPSAPQWANAPGICPDDDSDVFVFFSTVDYLQNWLETVLGSGAA